MGSPVFAQDVHVATGSSFCCTETGWAKLTTSTIFSAAYTASTSSMPAAVLLDESHRVGMPESIETRLI